MCRVNRSSWAVLFLAASCLPRLEAQVTIFEGARLITGDGTAPIENSAFLVDGDHFTRVGRRGEVVVPAGAVHVNLAGKTVMPTKVDLHGHIGFQHDVDGTMAKEYFTRENLVDHLQRLAYYGFSAIIGIGDLVDRSDLHGGRTNWGDVPLRVRDEIIPGAALFRTAGTGIAWPGSGANGHPSRTDVPYPVTTVEEARAAVDDNIKIKPEFIKIWVDDRGGRTKKLTPPLYLAIIDEAHKYNVPVAAHNVTLADAKLLMRAGVEGWLHLPVRDGEAPDDELLAIIKDRIARKDRPNMWFNPGAGWTATSRQDWDDPILRETVSPQQIQQHWGDYLAKLTPESVERSRANLKQIGATNALKLRAAGMKIVLGSDTGQTRFFIGWMGQIEMENWVWMGLSPMEAIVAATRDSAEMAHVNTGLVAAGRNADFIVLDANPLDNIGNTRKINKVYLRGKEVDRAAMRARWQAAWQTRAATPQLAPLPAVLRDYRPVTAERLKTPEDTNWLMIRRTYDGWGFSPLEQITPANVQRLRPAWIFATGEMRGHEAAPIVNNGVMFVTSPNNQVIAIDGKSGNVLWRYRRPRPAGASVPHETNRGVALYGDKVYYAAGEAVLVALDAKTGKEVWTTTVADNQSSYYITLAPLVAGGKVMVGASGGEFGIRGFVAAFDPDTGKELWRTYTVPAPGEPGSETWPHGEQWKTGGAPVWVTGNYDPETNLAYWGTGNGGPTVGDSRPGDNLYTTSTLALDVATGAIKGHFQYHPNDSWDWDEVSPPILVDYRRNGRTIKGLVDVARDGYLWFLERSSGPIRFIEGKPYVYQNVFRSLNVETGRPDVDPEHKPGTGKRADFCPGSHGGKTWPPIAFSPRTRMIYVPANNNLCSSNMGVEVKYTPGKAFVGIGGSKPFAAPGADHFGEVQAWNVDTGARVWTHKYATSPNWGAMLATAGGLVFSGGTNDRKIHAFDATTGKLLWEFPTNSGILAPPTSFAIDGKQYLAVLSGWGGDSRGDQATLNRLFPGDYPEVPEGGAVWVFALE